MRRREQRKKERGKKGTIYEEEYLVKSIKKLCEKATTMQSKCRNVMIWHIISPCNDIDDVRSLLSVLVPFGYMEEARNIQEKFAQIFVEFKEAIPTVFVPLQLPLGKVRCLKAMKRKRDTHKSCFYTIVRHPRRD